MATHLAAVLSGKGQLFELQHRLTPKPGPGEMLVAVKSVALNPADVIMREQGLFISTYPTVIGFDMAGLVIEIGDNVPTGTESQNALSFQPGITFVAAYSASAWKSCDPDYGAFQELCLVPWQHAVPILDERLSWSDAATLPVSAQVPLSAWDAMGIPRLGEINFPEENKTDKKEALLIWGASSSVGTMGVQSGRLMRESTNSPFASVYATAGSANKDYVTGLGADRVFDYKDPGVVASIVSAAKEDGLIIRNCFLATGQLALCQSVLKNFLGEDQDSKITAKIASAPIVPPGAEVISGIETIFVMPSMVEKERLEQFRYWMGTWLRENLAMGKIRPSPEPTVVGKGLEAINDGLDRIARGVSCTKLVIEIANSE